MPRLPRRRSPQPHRAAELFYRQNGERRDTDLHEPIIEEGDHAAAEAVSRRVMSRVLTPAQIDALMRGKSETKAMPMTPGKDESQSDFMSRCVPEMVGTGADKRPQDQAVAACLSIYRDHGKANGDGAKQFEDDVPDVDDDEGRDDYIDRCIDEVTSANPDADEDDVADACEIAWEERGVKTARGLRHKTHAENVEGMEFVLSDETPDRMGDIVSSTGWDTSNFERNPIALFNHQSSFPIGKWHNLRVEGGQLRGHLQVAPKGTSQRIDEIRALIDAGILNAVSVGFRSIEEEPLDKKNPWGGLRYTKQELVEASVVAVPANPNALGIAKSLNISTATLDLVFAKHGYRGGVVRRGGSTGKHATRNRNGKGSTMSTLAQRIQEVQNQIVAARDELTKHLESVDDSNVSDAQMQKTTDLNARIAQLTKLHAGLVESEKSLGDSTRDNGAEHRALTVVDTTRSGEQRDEGTIAAPAIRRKSDGKNPSAMDYIVRAQAIIIYQKLFTKLPDRIAREFDDPVLKAVHSVITRASTDPPAMTSVPGWAQELVQQIYTDFMALLIPKSIFVRLSGLGLSLSFGRAGKVVIPTRARTPTIAGSFVGEGNPIPVRQGAFTSQTLTPKKMAVITTWTRELDEHSLPAIEGLLRRAVQEDTGIALDSVLIDANPATTTRPAGLLNGIAALAATAGGGLAAFDADLKQVTNAVITGTYGNVRSPAWLMNEADINSAKLLSAPNTGIYPHKADLEAGRLLGYPVIPSVTVPAHRMIFIDAADFVSVTEGGPRFDISDQATLHMEDTNPLALATPGTPATVAAPQRSLFQTDSLALRLVQPMNWLQRRAGTVAWVDTVTWA